MTRRELQSEATRLRAQQLKARENEVFVGLTAEERAAYEDRAKRIRELDAQLEAPSPNEASASQLHEWNKQAETDTPQSEARQPYRDRERESSSAFTDSAKTGESKAVTRTQRTD